MKLLFSLGLLLCLPAVCAGQTVDIIHDFGQRFWPPATADYDALRIDWRATGLTPGNQYEARIEVLLLTRIDPELGPIWEFTLVTVRNHDLQFPNANMLHEWNQYEPNWKSNGKYLIKLTIRDITEAPIEIDTDTVMIDVAND